MKHHAIIFDLDGTLVDTVPIYEKAMIYMFSRGGAEISHEDFRKLYVPSSNLNDILAKYNLEDREDELRNIRDDFYIDLLRKETKWFPDGKKFLEALPKDTTKAIATGSWMKYVDAIHERCLIHDYFDTIVACDDFSRCSKPNPFCLTLTCERLGVDPKDCVYIGDQKVDMDAAKNAGMQGYLVKRPVFTPEDSEENADKVVDSLEELILNI